MKNIQEYIEKQMTQHRRYSESFKKIELTISNEHYHPKTGKRITFSEKEHLIRKDAEKRSKNILNKISNVDNKIVS